MTWTFSPTSIATDLAKVRLLCGDTNTDDQLLTDEEINFLLSEDPDIYEAAANSCTTIIAKLARDVDRSNLGMSASRSQKIQHYTDLAVSLRSADRIVAQPAFGGGSISDKDTIESDSDFPLPLFTRTRNDNTGSTT